MTVRDALALAVALSRATLDWSEEPQPGDLVVEKTGMRAPDPDAIGWLVAHGEAGYQDNPHMTPGEPTREVWDVTPLSGALGLNGKPYLRWKNAEFVKVPDRVVRELGLKPPPGWCSDFAFASSTQN
jgi:hypothetical protein